MSDDEFNLVDDLANLEGVDWDSLLSGPNSNIPRGTSTHELQVEPTNRSLRASSSDYSFDEMDQEAFAEVDTLERNTTQGQAGPFPFTGTFTVETDRSTPTKLVIPS
jgi:hypothetical protein